MKYNLLKLAGSILLLLICFHTRTPQGFAEQAPVDRLEYIQSALYEKQNKSWERRAPGLTSEEIASLEKSLDYKVKTTEEAMGKRQAMYRDFPSERLNILDEHGQFLRHAYQLKDDLLEESHVLMQAEAKKLEAKALELSTEEERLAQAKEEVLKEAYRIDYERDQMIREFDQRKLLLTKREKELKRWEQGLKVTEEELSKEKIDLDQQKHDFQLEREDLLKQVAALEKEGIELSEGRERLDRETLELQKRQRALDVQFQELDAEEALKRQAAIQKDLELREKWDQLHLLRNEWMEEKARSESELAHREAHLELKEAELERRFKVLADREEKMRYYQPHLQKNAR